MLPSRALLLLPLVGCLSSAAPIAERCDVWIRGVEPAEGAPGDPVLVYGTPLTTAFDSAAYIGGARASVEAVERTGCEACDLCRVRSGCTACDDCDTCAEACAEDVCVETLSLRVPDAAAGQSDLRIYNAHGESRPATFTVLGTPDSGSPDSGLPDSGLPDSGVPDSGAPDSGAP